MNIDVFLKTSNMPFPRQPATLKGIHKEKASCRQRCRRRNNHPTSFEGKHKKNDCAQGFDNVESLGMGRDGVWGR
ncbi:hypothetical protein, partial [Bilophila wadsworthia]|uniref:hypothetical protein n=2 Tax=Bilophila wadsworthia TaxID=35833 RepID=UPI003077C200